MSQHEIAALRSSFRGGSASARANPGMTTREKAQIQWLIIHGLAVGKPLAPDLVRVVSRAGFLPEQQPQPAPWAALYSADVFGAFELRSLVAWALRLSDDM